MQGQAELIGLAQMLKDDGLVEIPSRTMSGIVRVTSEGWRRADRLRTLQAETRTTPASLRPQECQPDTTMRPIDLPPRENHQYQVALSFAGEQREYVEEVARYLKIRGIDVFYDGFAEVSLWGKSGAETFERVFAEQSASVVMFVSKEYRDKAWCRHERRAALSRMIEEDGEYVLPVHFDDTEIDGLPKDTLYINAGDNTPAELAAKIAEKLGVQPFTGKSSDVPPPRMVSELGEVAFDYSSYNGRYVIGSGRLEFETEWTEASNTSIHVYNHPPSINGVALASEGEWTARKRKAASLDYTSRHCTPHAGDIVVLRNTHGFYAAVRVVEIKCRGCGSDRHELRFRYVIQLDGSDNFAGIDSL